MKHQKGRDIAQGIAGKLGGNTVFLSLASTFLAAGRVRCTEAIKQAIDAFLDGSDTSASDVDRARFQSVANQLDTQTAIITSAFVRRLKGNFDVFADLRELPEQDDESIFYMHADDMRILDDDDVAETLAMESAVSGAESRLARELYALNVRLGVLAELPGLTTDYNPFAPQPVLDAFLHALRDLECDTSDRVLIIDTFDRVFLRSLDIVFQDMNRILIDAGIVPRMRRAIDRQIAGSEKPEDTPADEDDRPTPRPPEDPAMREARQKYLEGWLYESIQSLMQGRYGDGADRDPAATLKTTDVTRHLDRLQRGLAGGESLPKGYANLKRQILKNAEGEGARSFSVEDEAVLDSVGMMFDYMRTDNQLPETFQDLVTRLEVPFLKAAVTRPDMLSHSDAPAKKLLNSIASAGRGWNPQSDRGHRLLNKAQEVVERVIEEYGADSSVFESLQDEFAGFLKKHERRAALTEKRESEAMAGREKLSLARRDVSAVLKEITKKRPVPGLVDDLLRKSWSHVMVLTRLKHGEESEEWKRAMATARELVWSVTFKPEKESVTRLRTRLPVLAKALASGLKKVGYSDGDIRKLLLNLKNIYAQLVKGTDSEHVIIEATADGLTIRGEDINELTDDDRDEILEIEDPEELEDVLGSIKEWQPGRWVTFLTDEGEETRAKLSWISPISGRYLFVDQQGLNAGEYSPFDLAENLIGEKVRPLETDEMTTRAMGAVVTQLKQMETEAAEKSDPTTG